jgi:hypothetical protein
VVQYKDNYVVDRERVNRTDNQGNKQGTFREYYENGNIKKEENYLDNQLHGYYREFDGNGELLVAIRYERGQIMEEIDEDMRELLDMKSTYDEQGRLIFTGVTRKAYLLGFTVSLIRQGWWKMLISTMSGDKSFQRGSSMSKGENWEIGKISIPPGSSELLVLMRIICNQEPGPIISVPEEWEQKGRFNRGRYQGIWNWYYPNGNIWREESYFNGREDGMFVEYDEQGNILAKERLHQWGKGR